MLPRRGIPEHRQFDDARAASVEGRRRYRELGQMQGEAQTLNNLGDIILGSDREAAHSYYLGALELAQRVNTSLEEARALEEFGMAYLTEDNREGARHLQAPW